jgi:hypothetical protein
MITDVKGALDQLELARRVSGHRRGNPRAEAGHVQERIEHARRLGWEDGMNPLGNMWFDSLL